MYDFKLPDIGEGLAEGELIEWAVQVDDEVKEGDLVATVSTDKVTVELYAPCAGFIRERCGEPGDVIKVGAVFLRIETGTSVTAPTSTHAAESVVEQDSASSGHGGRREGISPAVRRYAQSVDVDLSLVRGTGPKSSITREDIDAFLSANKNISRELADVTVEKLSGPRLVAAQRLAKSVHTMATSMIAFEMPVDNLVAAVRDLGPEAEKRGVKLTPLAVTAACVVEALKAHPRFNAVINEEEMALFIHKAINLGVAVAAAEGLLVPVIRDAGSQDLFALAADIVDVASRGRDDGLDVNDMRSSTFAISSTGGLEKSILTTTTPVVNYPNVATLWVSRISDRPWVVDGAIRVSKVMSASLAFDHRFIHGADAIAFINDIDAHMRAFSVEKVVL